MRKLAGAGVLLVALAAPAFAESRAALRVREAALVVEEVMEIQERTIPQELLDRAECVGVVPGLKKGAFIVGANYGKGVITCRPESGEGWTAPSTIRLEGGSFGFQLGGSSTDLLLLIMNRRGADKLLHQSRFTIGADASAAVGPVGRTAAAQTDVQLYADILSWSRSRGLFAGVSPQQILREGEPATEAGRELIEMLSKYSSRRKG
jgi:lipid-binding SYLF domain-containing protein